MKVNEKRKNREKREHGGNELNRIDKKWAFFQSKWSWSTKTVYISIYQFINNILIVFLFIRFFFPTPPHPKFMIEASQTTLYLSLSVFFSLSLSLFLSLFATIFLSYLITLLSSLFLFSNLTGYDKPCMPSRCCSSKGIFSSASPCISAPRGYQSDHFLFRIAMGRTYMITVPLITSAAAGNISTLHQEHVSLHHGAFSRINR